MEDGGGDGVAMVVGCGWWLGDERGVEAVACNDGDGMAMVEREYAGGLLEMVKVEVMAWQWWESAAGGLAIREAWML